MKLVLLHGTGAGPEWNWFRSVEQTYTNPPYSGKVWIPQLPNAGHPSGTEWANFVIENAPFELDDQTVVVGHSAGGVAALIVAQLVDRPLRATVAVATPPNNEFLQWEANDRLFDQPFDYEAIRRGAGYLAFIHSDNDSLCPMEQTKQLCEALDAEWILLPGKGHFSEEQGPQNKNFPELIDIINERVGL